MTLHAPLVSLQEALAFIPVRPGDATQDALVGALSLTATLDLERYTRRLFTRQVITEYRSTPSNTTTVLDLRGSGHETLDDPFQGGTVRVVAPYKVALSGLNVDAAAGISIYRDPRLEFAPDSLLDPGQYTVFWDDGVVAIKSALSRNSQSLKIVYTAGYDVAQGTLSDAAPADLKLACQFQTAFLFKRTNHENIGHDDDLTVSSTHSKTASARWNGVQGLCREAIPYCNPYRRLLTGTY